MGVVASMTGYGRAEARGACVAVAVEVRSLNHRFLEINLKLGRNLASQEAEVRRLLQGRLARGRVDLSAVPRRIDGRSSAVHVDLALGAEYLRQVRALAEGVGLPAGSIEVSDLVRMRHTEGAVLASDLGRHLDALGAWVNETEADLPVVLAGIQVRMRERVRALLTDEPVDPGRLAQEVATWAAKSDVAEECARLRSHLGQIRALLAGGGTVGRRLDFLAQELHREVNTIASKIDDGAQITRALEARTLVERIREQVQNVE